jgi:hypothetical protein
MIGCRKKKDEVCVREVEETPRGVVIKAGRNWGLNVLLIYTSSTLDLRIYFI